jgi:hypothetical protein
MEAVRPHLSRSAQRFRLQRPVTLASDLSSCAVPKPKANPIMGGLRERPPSSPVIESASASTLAASLHPFFASALPINARDFRPASPRSPVFNFRISRHPRATRVRGNSHARGHVRNGLAILQYR